MSRRMIKNNRRRRVVSRQDGFSYWRMAGAGVMAVLTFAVIVWLLYNNSKKSGAISPFDSSSCSNNFNVYRFNAENVRENDLAFFNTILLGELHGQNEEAVANCIAQLARPNDHLLVEAPSEGAMVACDSIHSAYGRFNGQLECYGFDVPVDEARRLYSDLAFRANFIAQRSNDFLNRARTGSDAIRSIKAFADFLKTNAASASHMPQSVDPQFIDRNAKYLIKLANKMRGLNLEEMRQFLLKENNNLAKKAGYYEARSRGGPTNHALSEQIRLHQEELKGSKNRLFVVAGANHVNPRKNRALRARINEAEPVAILMPKT